MSKIGSKLVFRSQVEADIARVLDASDFALIGDEPVLIKVQVKRRNQNETLGVHNKLVTAEIEWSGQN